MKNRIASSERSLPNGVDPHELRDCGDGMSRAEYYWRQADICMRLSLLSEDAEIADLLINKALQLLAQADEAAEDGQADGQAPPPAHVVDGEPSKNQDPDEPT